MKSLPKLQQPAGAAARPIPQVGGRQLQSIPISRDLVYSLSVEHAAIALKLTREEEELVLAMGTGADDRDVAKRLHCRRTDITARVDALRKRTRLSRMSLGILGYHLAGQYSIEFRPAA